jgi:serine/threonine protein kinase
MMSAKPNKEKSSLNMNNETNKNEITLNDKMFFSPQAKVITEPTNPVNPIKRIPVLLHKKHQSTQIINKKRPSLTIKIEDPKSKIKASPNKPGLNIITEVTTATTSYNTLTRPNFAKSKSIVHDCKNEVVSPYDVKNRNKGYFPKPTILEYEINKQLKKSTTINNSKKINIHCSSKSISLKPIYYKVEKRLINLNSKVENNNKIKIMTSRTKSKTKDSKISPKEKNYLNINYLKTEPDREVVKEKYSNLIAAKHINSIPTSIPISKFSTPKNNYTKKVFKRNDDIIPFSPFKSNILCHVKQSIHKISNSLEIVNFNSSLDKEMILNKYRKILNLDEKNEIKLIDEIYFLGNIQNEQLTSSPNRSFHSSLSKNINISRPASANLLNTDLFQINEPIEEEVCHDDEHGNYIIVVGDHLNYRYEILSELGSGSFGQAVKCFDHKNREYVCVKIIKNKKKFSKQAQIEINILEYIRDKNDKDSNTVKIIEHFMFRNHICIVFELLDINLYELIKNQDFKGLELAAIRKLAVQLLYSLIFLRKHRIIHCDLKPENILLTNAGEAEIKVVDFGSSCFENEKLYTYIQSRFYRAPEIILGINYDCSIDMWSFGCIIVELFTGIPIFPGENEKDQLGYIMEYFGIPPFEYLNKAKKKNQFFENNYNPILTANSKGKIRYPNTKKLTSFLRGADESFIDLVLKCLEWEPSKRITPLQAILHPWIGVSNEVYQHYKNIELDEAAPQYALTESNYDNIYSPKPKIISKKIKNISSSINIQHNIVPKGKLMEICNKNGTFYKNKSLSKNKNDFENFNQPKPKINLTLDVNINFNKFKKIKGDLQIHSCTNKSTKKFTFV